MIRPAHILGFLLIVLSLLAAITFLFPENTVEIAGVKIKYRSLDDILHPEKIEYADISDIVKSDIAEDTASAVPLDTTTLLDTIRADADLLAASEYPILTSESGQKKLHGFFKAMENARSASKPVRIMHYGDSQIEADHITGYLRERLQQSFGGNGPGLLAVKPVTQKLSWRVSASEEWNRYTLFGKIDSTITHKRYGPMISLFRFAPPWNDSLPNDSIMYSASFEIKNSFQGYPASNHWDNAKLFYGNSHRPVRLIVKDDEDEIFLEDSLMPSETLKIKTIGQQKNQFMIEMQGYDSPDVYGVSLESKNGIIVDNIPLRGSAGTFVTQMEYSMMLRWLNTLNAKLLILQFGVNVVSDEVEDFGYYENWMFHQLNAIAQMRPDLPVIVVGISDMSKKDGTEYVSYEAVSKIRDAQKNAAMNAGFAFWDMYEAMGGENSMPSWVWADPPLANTDFTHFNVKGAKIISNMLYNALMLEYRDYKKAQQTAAADENQVNDEN
ncbi:MAG: GDSL-type esterase/lipase family protein [Bacteroidales bacterium]|jgi:lysophospholipase L1-like esterase|nr:GDSL-type esterase/lipase family protein [Bacteroidales bacterium]